MALLSRQSIEEQEAHPEEDETRNLGGFYIVLVLIAALSMFMRIFSRKITQLTIEWDDWTFLLGSVLAEGSFIVLLVYAFDAGLGKHWVFLTPEQKILFHKLNYSYNILNLLCYPIIKISILLLYLRIFFAGGVRMLCWAGIIFLSCMCTANTLVAIFSCKPVRGFFDASVPATCIDDTKFSWATAILNVVTDFYILVLPIPVVRKLNTTLGRKIAISMIFTVGGLTFIISIIRIVYYFDFSPADPSYSFLPTAYATPAEACLAIIVSSAPTWRPVWTYTSNVTHSLLLRSCDSHDQFSITAAHSHAQSIVLTEHPKHKNPGVSAGESTIILRTASTTKANSSVGGRDGTSEQRISSTTGRAPSSTAHSSHRSELSTEVATSQSV